MDNDENKLYDYGDLEKEKEEKKPDEIPMEDFHFSGDMSISRSDIQEEIEYAGEQVDDLAKGLVFIFTGEGKGKTTAALGMALRTAGWGRPLIFIQMMKKRPYGEIHAFDLLGENFEIFQLGREEHVKKGNPDPEDIELAERALKMARESIDSRQYDWVFLDESITAMDFGLITEKDILDLIDRKPSYLHLVFTGRGATQALIDAADCVTKCEKIKHHFDAGVEAQKNVEY